MVNKYKTGDCLLFGWDTKGDKLSFNKIFGDGIVFTQKLEYARTHNIKELIDSNKYKFTRWSHVGMITRVTKEGVYIGEQQWEYQNKLMLNRDFDYYVNNGTCKVRRPKVVLSGVNKLANERIGRTYDIVMIPNILLRTLTLFMKKWVTRISIVYKGALAFLPIIKGLNLVRSYVAKATPERTICTEANGRIYLDASKGKLDVAKEFNLSCPDELMPMHFALSKQFEDVK